MYNIKQVREDIAKINFDSGFTGLKKDLRKGKDKRKNLLIDKTLGYGTGAMAAFMAANKEYEVANVEKSLKPKFRPTPPDYSRRDESTGGFLLGRKSLPFEGTNAMAKADTEYMFNKFKSSLGLSSAQAAALVGNADYETGSFQFNQELGSKEYLKGGRGGYGLMQFTGSRRKSYENFVAKNNLPIEDSKSGVAYVIYELTEGGEKKQLARLKAAKNVAEASDVVAKYYLRPRKETANYGERQARSQAYYDTYINTSGLDQGKLTDKTTSYADAKPKLRPEGLMKRTGKK